MVSFNDAQRLRLAAGGELEFPSARTVVKFINKNFIVTTIAEERIFSLELLLNNEQKLIIISSAPLAANRC